MAYTELVKNFNRIRDYMREFYVYGFKSREEYTRKSARSYDDERRRIESWLGDYMKFRQTAEGKNVFLSIDSRVTHHNPLYKAWKTKSFTDGDITLHFILMDIMETAEEPLPVSVIAEKIDEYLSVFSEPRFFDESTVRKKLKEYVEEGLLETEKCGKTLYYKKAADCECYDRDVLDFFSEAAPCGVVGSFLLDKENLSEEFLAKEEFVKGELKQNRIQQKKSGRTQSQQVELQQEKLNLQQQNFYCVCRHREKFGFKHHYITSAIDSEILCQLFQAIHEKRSIIVRTLHKDKEKPAESKVVPLQIMISVQSGRQYLMAYMAQFKRISAFRIDHIVSIKFDKVSERFDELREQLEKMKPHLWGVSTQSRAESRMETVEFTVHYEQGEEHIHHRLEREKRCGTVEKIDDHTSRFYAEVYDSMELIPWIRTFICRITDIHISNASVEAKFRQDLEKMYELYGIGGEEK